MALPPPPHRVCTICRYPGSYERFLELKEERMNAEGAARDRARNKLRGELAWMRKQPKARQAKSKAREERFFELKTKVRLVSIVAVAVLEDLLRTIVLVF